MGRDIEVRALQERWDGPDVIQVRMRENGEHELVDVSSDRADLPQNETLEPAKPAVDEEERTRCLDEVAGERDALDAMDLHGTFSATLVP
jgi:hypothetical protein